MTFLLIVRIEKVKFGGGVVAKIHPAVVLSRPDNTDRNSK